MRPFIRWSGNKTNYKKYILPLFPHSYATYIEPFLGGGSIFLSVQPKKWIINDANPDLMSTWLAVKDKSQKLINNIRVFGETFLVLSLDRKKERCKEMANDLNRLKPGMKRTTYFLLLKFCSYMGIIMKKNTFVFSAIDLEYIHLSDNKLPSSFEERYFQNIQHVSEYLNSGDGQILNEDYRQVLAIAKKDDFVFLDPPYVESHDYAFNYNHGEVLDDTFIVTLLKECKKLDKRNVRWMMTQADTPRVRNLFAKYNITEMKVYRAARRTYTTELIIRNCE